MNISGRQTCELTREHEQLGRRITRFRLLRLLLLTLLVAAVYLGFWRALKRVDREELNRTRLELARIDAKLGKYAITVDAADDPLGFRNHSYDSGGVPLLAVTGVSASPPAPDEKERKQLASQFQDQVGNLRWLYGNAFRRKLELGPFSLSLDVRNWPSAFPPVFFLFGASSVYVHILRKKRELIEFLAARRIEAAPAEATDFDRLEFARLGGNASPLSAHPFQYGEWFQRIYVVALLAVVVPLARFASSCSWAGFFTLAGLMGCAAAYLGVYGRYVSTKLESHAARVAGIPVPPTWIARCWEGLRRWSRPKIFRNKPKMSLLSGSLLILVTLHLGTCVGSCGSPRPGYELVEGIQKWPSAGLTETTWSSAVLAPLTRAIYTASLALAGLTLIFLLLPGIPPRLRRGRRLATLLFTTSATISLFVIGDFSFLALQPITALALPWVLFWLVPWILWLRFGLSRKEVVRARWQRIRTALEGLYFPVILCDFALLVTAVLAGFYGLIAFFFGIHLLTFGFEGLAFGGSPAVPGPAKSRTWPPSRGEPRSNFLSTWAF